MFYWALLVSSFLVASAEDKFECPSGWTFYDKEKTCAKVFSHPVHMWSTSRDECISKGGDLIRINDAAKQTFLQQLHGNYSQVWIGLHMIETDGARQFYWLNDTTPAKYFYWFPNEPNNNGLYENCVNTLTVQGYWNDHACWKKYPYVCEKPAVPVPVQCPTGWVEYKKDHSCIKSFNKDRKTWADARKACQGYGGDLVCIENEEKQKFIGEHYGKVNVWLGLRKKTVAGAKRFYWLDETTPAEYLNFARGEPNNSGGYEDCINIWGWKGEWNDDSCWLKYGYVCEKYLPPYPILLVYFVPPKCPLKDKFIEHGEDLLTNNCSKKRTCLYGYFSQLENYKCPEGTVCITNDGVGYCTE